MAAESTDRDFIVDPVIHEALENGTVDPDGLNANQRSILTDTDSNTNQ